MSITDLIPIPSGINTGLNSARQITMLSILGNPRSSYDQECRAITSDRLKDLVITDRVAGFRVTGLRPAVESLAEVMRDVERENSDVFAVLGTAGMLCARLVRGSKSSISNHSWGTAIDLNINGQLDSPGNGKTQKGLAAIAPIFNRHGWYWGAAFPREDAMHFELSDQKIRQLHANGAFGNQQNALPDPVLSLGDRGREVKRLQEKLKAKGSQITVDGDFGRGTLAAVMAFQASKGLTVDGAVGRNTWRELDA